MPKCKQIQRQMEIVEAKYLGQRDTIMHFFCNQDEVHGWVVGLNDAAKATGILIEYIKQNDEIIQGGESK